MFKKAFQECETDYLGDMVYVLYQTIDRKREWNAQAWFLQRKYWKDLFEIPFTQKHTRTSYLKIVFKYEKSLLTLLYLMAKPDDIVLFALCHNTKDDERSSGLWEADITQTSMCMSMAFLKPDTQVYNHSSLNCGANDKKLLNFLICKYPFKVISKS